MRTVPDLMILALFGFIRFPEPAIASIEAFMLIFMTSLLLVTSLNVARSK
jgi:hypothetical protein